MESEGMNLLINSTVFITIFVGACVLLLMYIIKLLNADQKNVEHRRKNEKLSEQQQSEKKKDSGASAKTKKKATETRWTGRSDKQAFSHPWLLTTLKGHTSQVLDMDYSSSGKYLASCGEEEPDSGDDPGLDTNSSCGNSSDSNQEISPPSSLTASPRTKGLSRRQRKNRRREDHSPPESKKKSKPKRPTTLKPVAVDNPIFEPIPLYSKLLITSFPREQNLALYLRGYILNRPLMITLGYPVEFQEYPGRFLIVKDSHRPTFQQPQPVQLVQVKHKKYYSTFKSSLDVNAREFIPGSDYYDSRSDDSGQGSGNSSDSSEGSDDSSSGFGSSEYPKRELVDNQLCYSRTCVRCDKEFYITTDSTYLKKEKCVYHWGKLQKIDLPGLVWQYTCCQGGAASAGCTTCKCHVWNGVVPGCNFPMENFIYLRSTRPVPIEDYHKAFALDCEMCYTVDGLELAKVTVVDMCGRLVYDSFVKPEKDIIDYNTRFSGITARDLKSCSKTLKQVQRDLMRFLHSETILVGHGLENDLRALRIAHKNCVDTSILFQPDSMRPKRHSLKHLSLRLLNKEIQGSASGHNSYEDARTAMELVLYKVSTDLGLSQL